MITHNTATGVPNRVVSQDPVCFSASRFRRRRRNAHLAFHKPLCHYERVPPKSRKRGGGLVARRNLDLRECRNPADQRWRWRTLSTQQPQLRKDRLALLAGNMELAATTPFELSYRPVATTTNTPSATGHLRGKAERTSACRLADSFKLRGVCFVFSSDRLEAVLK